MRMWMVNPKKMCRKHLLGEHVELHMFVGTIKKGISIQGYIDNGLVNPRMIKKRHKELVKEMERRGYNHNSPLKIKCSKLPVHFVDINVSKFELNKRDCSCKY